MTRVITVSADAWLPAASRAVTRMSTAPGGPEGDQVQVRAVAGSPVQPAMGLNVAPPSSEADRSNPASAALSLAVQLTAIGTFG